MSEVAGANMKVVATDIAVFLGYVVASLVFYSLLGLVTLVVLPAAIEGLVWLVFGVLL